MEASQIWGGHYRLQKTHPHTFAYRYYVIYHQSNLKRIKCLTETQQIYTFKANSLHLLLCALSAYICTHISV